MADTTLETARARYITHLKRARPVVDEQLSDVDLLLDSLLGKITLPMVDLLDAARADYLARLRERCRSIDEQVLDLAVACTKLFAPALGLSEAAA
jgi:hypothetical protein